MWNFASNAIAGSLGPKKTYQKSSTSNADCSDDEVSSCISREEVLECPICWESFNMVENVPYVLWCGHTLCKNCIFGLQWAVVKFPTVPIQLPFFISCPWCNLLSFRLVYKGNLTFPRKNYFLLWMVESMNSNRVKSQSSVCREHNPVWPSSNAYCHHGALRAPNMHAEHFHVDQDHASLVGNYFISERINAPLRKSLAFFVYITAKFALVIIFLLITLCAIPASAAILVLYILVTALFGLPSFFILYIAFPSLDWIVKEIFS